MKKSNILILCGALVVLAVFLALFKGCKENKGTDKSISVGRDTVLDIRIVSDTVRDTIWQRYYVELPGKDSLIHDTMWQDGEGFVHRRYQDSTEDETLKLKFTAYTTGKLDSIRLSYFMKAPKTTKEAIHDSIYLENKIIDKRYMPGFYLGSAALVNGTKMDIMAKASISLKNNWQFGYARGLTSKINLIEASYRIAPKKEK